MSRIKTYNIDLLVYFEPHQDVESAKLREKQLKRRRYALKGKFIESVNPDWKDISDQIPLEQHNRPRP